MKLTKLIESLGGFEPNGLPVLSIYINAEPGQNGRDTFPIWLKTELSGEGEKYKDDEQAAARFESVVEKINGFIDTELNASANGLAIFAGLGDGGIFQSVQLDVPFKDNKLISLDRPHIFPLAQVIQAYPRYAVLWADTNKADIYIFGGENRIRTDVEVDSKVEHIQNEVTQQSQPGGWSQQRFQRRVENFHVQHAKEVVAELEEVMKKYDAEHLVICGDEETILPLLKPELSKPLEEKLIGSVSMSQYDSAEEIHEKTLERLNTELAAKQDSDVERLNDAAKAAAGLGTLGVENTLKALANGQVQELFISADVDAIDYSKKKIKRILKDYRLGDDTAPADADSAVTNPEEVADQLVIRAINTNAKITIIKDAAKLKTAGGVGAILRFNMNAQAGG